jgi:hypothetical protein
MPGRNLVVIVGAIKDLPDFRYITPRSPGGLLTGTKIKDLVVDATNQIDISMSFLDARQPLAAQYPEYNPRAITVGACFDACRSEAEAPVSFRRLGELTGVQ